MTASTCEHCGTAIEQSGRGRPRRFCSEACQKSSERGASPRVPGRAAAKPPRDDTLPGPVGKVGQRAFYRDLGDGDPCPQDAGHGRMFFMPSKQRQWCPALRHEGNPFYAHDGLTPAPRSGAVEPGSDAPRRESDRDLPSSEAPESMAGASIPEVLIPAVRSPRPGEDLTLAMPFG